VQRIKCLVLLLMFLAASRGLAQPAPTLLRDFEKFIAADRPVGSDAASAAAETLATELSALAKDHNGRLLRQRFYVAAPVVERCNVTAPGTDVSLKLWPFMPAMGTPAAFENGIGDAPVIYVGDGTLAELKGKTIAGQFVALNITGEGPSWQTIAALGAKGLIFLGDGTERLPAFTDKQPNVPVGVPRFFADDASTVAAIRDGRVKSLRIDLVMRWQDRAAENVLLLLPGRQNTPKLANAKDRWYEQMVVLQTRYDGVSVITGRAPGATQAANTAALLETARQIAAMPDRCTVLVAFTAGDEYMNRGTRELLALIGREQRDNDRAVTAVEKRLTEANALLLSTRSLVDACDRIARSSDFAALADDLVRERVEIEIDRLAARVETTLQNARLEVRTRGAGTAEAQEAAKTLHAAQAEKQLLVAARQALTRGTADVTTLPADVQDRIRAAARQVHSLWARQLPKVEAQQATAAESLDFRKAWSTDAHPPLLHIEWALTSGTARCGFFSRGHINWQNDATGAMAQFSREIRRYAGALPDSRAEDREPAFDADSVESRFTLETYFMMRRAFSVDAAIFRGQAAGAFATVRDASNTIDTPHDTPANFDEARFLVQAQAVRNILCGTSTKRGALADPLFYGRAALTNTSNEQQVRLFERALGETIPRIGAAFALVGVEADRDRNNAAMSWSVAGMRRFEFNFTRADGEARFIGLQRNKHRLHAYDFDDYGQTTRVLSANQTDLKGLVSEFTPDGNRPARALLFECQRLDVFGLFDPRYLDQIDRIEILDARRGDRAQFTNIYARDAMAAVFMPRGTSVQPFTWQLLGAKGDLANRLIMTNATEAKPEGVGFTTVDRAVIGAPAHRTARDFYQLNEKRRRELETFGISNDVIDELHGKSKTQLDAASAALEARDYLAWQQATASAWALQSQVYSNLINTSNGIIKGIIFLLLGVIPFAYFLERLVIASTSVYRQILWFALFFAAMVGALWFHPAFRISNAPLMILLAFLILILSSTVVYILFGKFEEEIARLRGAAAGAHSANLKRGAVLGAAISLGLSNMRRRGTRTALTLVTLVLLTFTLLAFTSVRESVQITPRIIEDAANQPAHILVRQRLWRTLPPQVLPVARALAGENALIARRYWWASERAETSWLLPVQNSDASSTFYANGIVGFDPTESHFHREPLETLLPQWSRYEADPTAAICWLPRDVQSLINVQAGEEVLLLGRRLVVVGFFDADKFTQFKTLTGDDLAPVDAGNANAAPTVTAAVNPEDLATLPETATRTLPARSIVVVPAWVLQQNLGRLTSVAVKLSGVDDSKVLDAADEFARRSAFAVFASDGKQSRSINAAQSSRPQDLGSVIIPMVIAGVIVLNTMLGAVAERTREIHVYTSVGLAPAHVGMLFLAEAAALGTLGVVFGYIFGQGLATILSWTNLMGGVALNYSSMAAVWTMGLVLALVMFSAVWPARSATRVAAPSLKRDWVLPKPQGDELVVDLPFTVNEQAARGVCAFLEEYFVTITQSGAGRFTADHLQAFSQEAPNGRTIRGLRARVWLAPYDLGVIEAFELAIHPTVDDNVFEVRIQITREAGNPGTWYRLNRPFLTEVRKQFLLWRTVSPELMQTYMKRSDELFSGDEAHARRS